MNRLTQLLALNKGRGEFRAEHDGASDTLYLYDVIVSDDYWGGTSALSFVKAINAMKADEIHVRIDSPGGDVFAAHAMAQAMRDHESKIVVHIDGRAASAATFLVMAADESYISNGAMFMIHNAWTIAMGNANDFLDTAALLEKIDGSIREDYAQKTGIDTEQLKQWMDEETYFLGREAVENGFVDKLAAESPKNQINWDMSAYKKAPPIADEPKIADEQADDEETPADLSGHYRQLQYIQLTA